MATRTSVGSGPWATAETWDTGIPADGDDVVIASGHTVTFNADQSAFTTGVKITITGTLNHALTGGPYTMFIKTGASVVGAGTWNIGTSANPIPFAVKHTITGAAGWYVDGVSGLTMTVYGAEPSIKTIKLSGNEAIGQTELSVDTDVRTDIWAVGDIIRIDDINKAQESEERTIAAGGIAADAITVTSGLTAAKSTGAVVSLITRNVKIIGTGTGARTIYRVGSTANKLTIGGGMFMFVNKTILDACHYTAISGGTFSGNTYGLSGCSSATISGGTFSGNANGLSNCSSATISGGTFSGNTYGLSNCSSATISGGTFSGNANGLSYCSSATISGGTFSGNTNGLTGCSSATISGGTFSGNANGLSNCSSATISGGTFSGNDNGLTGCNPATISGGTFSGNTYGLSGCSPATISGGTFSGNTYGLNSCNPATISGGTFSGNTNDLRRVIGSLFNIELTSATEHHEYTFMASNGVLNCQSFDHDGNAGALKVWCLGGVVTSQTSTKPTGYVQAYTHALESATYPCFWYKTFTVAAGETVSVEVQLRKDASMTYLPRVYLMKSIENPLVDATAAEDSFTMTDSTDTWESDTFTIDNSAGTYDKDYTLWFVGKNATGSVYSAVDITTQGGGTSSVKILPFTGKVGL